MKNRREEETTQKMKEELMARDIETEQEEEEDIEPILDDPNIRSKPPLTSGHLQFSEIEIVPPPNDMVMDILNFTFDQLKKRIQYERRMYYLDEPVHIITIEIDKVITSNTRRNLEKSLHKI